MLLHLSTVNEQREQQNKLPVNGLWFWGEGELPAKTNVKLKEVYSRQAVVKGLCHLNQLDCHSDFDVKTLFQNMTQESRVLLVLDDLFAVTSYGDVMAWQSSLSDLYMNQLEPIIQLAMKKKIKLNIHPCNGVCYQISSKNKFRFFRDKRITNYIDSYE